MGFLDKFEHSLERLVEGTFGTVFNQSLQPAEIGKRLERAMTGNTRVSVGTTLVPNEYVVRLHPRDYAQFAEYVTALCRQFETFLAQKAGERRYTVVDRIHVSLVEAGDARRRDPVVIAAIRDSRSEHHAEPVAPAEPTAAFPVARAADNATWRLEVQGGPAAGERFTVPPGSSTIGRSTANTFVIDSPDVSRRHAKLECSSGRLRIYDLNSTNGTRVNGDAVRISDLDAGDEVRLGNQILRVASSSGARGRR